MVIFTFSSLMFAANFVVTVIPKKLNVRNEAGEIIGSVSLPDPVEQYGLIFLSFVVLSGFQIWTLSLIGKGETK